MSAQKINPRFAILAIIMIAVAALRIPNAAQLGPLSNFTPIGAMGLFGAAYFSKSWKAFGFPLFTLLASDLIINIFVYNGQYGIMYGSWYWVYGGFVAIVLLGRLFIKKVSVTSVLLTGIGSTLVYWLIVDFGVFLFGCTDITTGQTMDHSFASLIKCYAQGAPYMKNFLIGTLLYSSIMFGAFEWMKSKNSFLQLA
ncbi:DUF6580 family putative transport protein [Lacibacter sp.]|uniref:DUF6580 family putative transport protein n=1 Tax=Lacibacter sp. TaxID=1915409 RepID=UPI002B4ADD7D|nr:DUF6580 family putative transport protein [Lacibacter sp.]HLP39584.1 DUF6580 family putative transport protein [Lacibacter sp.]